MIETLPAIAPETVTPIKPSEALRLGRLTRPVRIENAYWNGPGTACAVAAMVVGYGYPASDDANDDGMFGIRAVEDALWKGLKAAGARCSCSPGPEHLPSSVSHLNDHHHWSDDQIVAWLEGLGL